MYVERYNFVKEQARDKNGKSKVISAIALCCAKMARKGRFLKNVFLTRDARRRLLSMKET